MRRDHLTSFLDSNLTKRFLRFGRYTLDHPRPLTLSVLVILVATGLAFTYRKPSWRQLGPFSTAPDDNIQLTIKLTDLKNATEGLLNVLNDLSDSTPPDYSNYPDTTLRLIRNQTNGAVTLPRLEGEVLYYDKNQVTDNTAGGQLIITLPPKLISLPDKLKFEGKTISIPPGPTDNIAIEPYTINVSEKGSGDAAYYQLTIGRIKKNEGTSASHIPETTHHLALSWQLIRKAYAYSPPPAGNICVILPSFCPGVSVNANAYNYRLTFVSPVSSANVTKLATYLLNNKVADTASLQNSDCSQIKRTHICLLTQAKFIPEEYPNDQGKQPSTSYSQSIALEGISVAGNVSGGGTLSNFKVASGAIVVGGTIKPDVSGETKLDSYLPNTKLDWSKVGPDLKTLYDKRTAGTGFDGKHFGANKTWYLNSATSDPTNSTVTSFSAPPEGKLWYQKDNDSFIFNGDIKFSGSGTIAFNRNVTFEGKVECDQGTRLGIITTGNITFNTDKVECGAYVALDTPGLGQDISFENSVRGEIEGIFVASGSIKLPTVGGLTGPYEIRYDAAFAENPTVLFREILKLLTTTSS